MKAFRAVLLLALLVALAAAVTVARGAFAVAVGYSAKQFCSGIFVAGLPPDFILERDILPRMAILGPARGFLELDADEGEGIARARLLGVGARAVHDRERGCSLHVEGPGDPPRALSQAAAPLGVPAALETAVDAAFAEPASGGRNTLALLVSRGGSLLIERYAPPVTAVTPMQGWSMNKSLMSTWVGIQSARGGLDPAQPLRALLPAEPAIADIDERLTLLHLLQMESGLDFEEVYGPGSDVTRMLYVAPTMWTVPAGVPQAYAPGRHFAYSSGDTVLASLFWQRSLAQPYSDWIRDNFSTPLGLSTLVAEADASGIQVGSSYAYLGPRDWLAVGQLWLDAWHGRSDLLPRGWLRDSVRPRQSDAAGRYGRGFWLNTGGLAFPGLPDSLFYAGGNAGQFVVVVPEWELVVVRLGLTDPASSTGTGDFLAALAALVDAGALPPLPAPARASAGGELLH